MELTVHAHDAHSRTLADRADGPITWEDLEVLDAREVACKNADLALLAPLVFDVGGAPVRFGWVPCVDSDLASLESAAWLWLTWSGMPLLVAASPALADAVTQSVADLGMDQLGDTGIDLFAQLMLAPNLPPGLTLRQAALARERLAELPQGLEPLGVWQGRHRDSGEPSGHRLLLWAGPGFPLAALLGAVAGLAAQRLRPALASLPLALPLVAARWQVGADQLLDLAVGDVLILG